MWFQMISMVLDVVAGLLAGTCLLRLVMQRQRISFHQPLGRFVFALTDWLDGYLARRLNQTSAFGAFLDPVADKFLVCACLLVLLDLQRVDVFVALIIIGREIAISALREWMATIGANRSVAVHRVGKIKTGVQMVAIGLLLFDGRFLGLLDTRSWGTALIWLSVVLTVWSMVYYLQKAIPEIRARSR
jgi:CDP-diacylglycerol--glycerol-3-phosphate 3-phosphatidyltransferase